VSLSSVRHTADTATYLVTTDDREGRCAHPTVGHRVDL
jgi:hypothetical protein